TSPRSRRPSGRAWARRSGSGLRRPGPGRSRTVVVCGLARRKGHTAREALKTDPVPRYVGSLTRPTPYRYGRGMTAIALGADHAGFPLKEDLKAWLIERGYEVVDCGTQSSESVDYPDYAAAVAGAVAAGKAERGVLGLGGLGAAVHDL